MLWVVTDQVSGMSFAILEKPGCTHGTGFREGAAPSTQVIFQTKIYMMEKEQDKSTDKSTKKSIDDGKKAIEVSKNLTNPTGEENKEKKEKKDAEQWRNEG